MKDASYFPSYKWPQYYIDKFVPQLCNLVLVGPFMIKTILGDEKIPNWRASILVLFKMAMGTRWQCCSVNDSS